MIRRLVITRPSGEIGRRASSGASGGNRGGSSLLLGTIRRPIISKKFNKLDFQESKRIVFRTFVGHMPTLVAG